jgi:chitinase
VTATSGSDVHSTISKLTVHGFLISATTPAAVNPGSSSSSTVTLTALNGYSLPVQLACSVTGAGSPPPACNAQSFSTNPVTPTAAGAQTVLTITTTAPASAAARHWHIATFVWVPAFGLFFFGLCFAAPPKQRKVAATLFLSALAIVALSTLPSCGGKGACSVEPTGPTGLTASSTTKSSTMLNWNPPAVGANCGTISYTIYQNGSKIGTSSATGFTVTGLSPSTTYTFTVAASDAAGMGPQSAGLKVTTTSGATPAGNYTVTVIGTDANGLSNAAQVILTVN